MTRDPGLAAVLRGLGNPRIAVVGDFMLDRYVWGDTSRVSPEAPVPVVQAQREEERPGGAGNVAANLCELGARVECFGVVGSDRQGGRLVAGLEALGAAVGGLLALDAHTTTQKIRIMARSQQIMRLDREEARPIPETAARVLLERLHAARWDAVVLSDYGKGVLPETLVARVLEEARLRKVPSLVDPKHPDLARYRGASLVTPNRGEAEAAWGGPLRDLPALAAGGEALRQRAGLEALLVTLGQEGMFLLREGSEPLHVPTAARAVFDVTGAGDTVL
ncbi:MAG: bifunctional heptose 7-phosphate kinase/heptose 1-phosphate adenyltransferase, partial [Planctomycetota bacterium]